MYEKKETLNNKFMSIADWNYLKSYKLIYSNGKANLMLKRLWIICLMYMKKNNDGDVYSKINVKEIIKLIGSKSERSVYQQVKESIYNPKNDHSFLDWIVIYENDKTKQFDVINIISSIHYEKGQLKILYNSNFSEYLFVLQKKYNVLNLEEELKLTSSNSIVLYELLKSQLSYLRTINKNNAAVEWNVYLTNLKLKLGLISADDNQTLQKALFEKAIDYDEIDKYLLEKKIMPYPDYHGFKQSVLSKAVNEINKKTSLSISFVEEKCGHGGKVKNLIFYIDEKK